MLLKSSGLVVVSLVGLLRICNGLDNGVALTPPMGFNSYMAGLGGGGEQHNSTCFDALFVFQC